VEREALYRRVGELDPELERIEAEARAVRDPGGPFFCANHAWFSIKYRLRERLGVWRRPRPGEPPEAAAELAPAEAFEAAFDALYPLLPPCRACGCALFEVHNAEERAAPSNASR
jgi:hypothetical protein